MKIRTVVLQESNDTRSILKLVRWSALLIRDNTRAGDQFKQYRRGWDALGNYFETITADCKLWEHRMEVNP